MTYEIAIETIAPQRVAVRTTTCSQAEIGEFIGSALGQVISSITAAGMTPIGAPLARFDMVGDQFRVEVGFPVEGDAVEGVDIVAIPGGEAAVTMHVGPYDGVGGAYSAITDWFTEAGQRPAGAPWEEYLDGPEVAEPRTRIVWPCASA